MKKPAKWSRTNPDSSTRCPICLEKFVASRAIVNEKLPLITGEGEVWTQFECTANEYLHKDGQYCIHQLYDFRPVDRKFVLREGNKK